MKQSRQTDFGMTSRAPHLAPAVCPSSATDLSPACAECVGSDWVNVNQDFPVEERELSNVKFARAASRVYEELCPGGKGALACRALELRAKPESGSLKCPMSPLHVGVEGLLGGKSPGLFSRALLADMELTLWLLVGLVCAASHSCLSMVTAGAALISGTKRRTQEAIRFHSPLEALFMSRHHASG